jgi:signal transduction histidine kinase
VVCTREDHEDGPITTRIDPTRVGQVVSNLLSNALKFTRDGIISIKLRIERDNKDENNVARVAIADMGRGIDAEILPKLFEKFVTKSEKGTGLGLYISKGIIEAHGGKIWAENNNRDGSGGATFIFTLPL